MVSQREEKRGVGGGESGGRSSSHQAAPGGSDGDGKSFLGAEAHEKREEELAVDIDGDILHSIDSSILEILDKSIERRKSSSLSDANKFSSGVPPALQQQSFRSDELNVAVYVHHVVASGGGDFFGGGTAEVAHAIPELDSAIERIEEEIRRTISTSSSRSPSVKEIIHSESSLSHSQHHSPFSSSSSSSSLASLLLFLGGGKRGEFEGLFEPLEPSQDVQHKKQGREGHLPSPYPSTVSSSPPKAIQSSFKAIDSSNEDLYRLCTLLCHDDDDDTPSHLLPSLYTSHPYLLSRKDSSFLTSSIPPDKKEDNSLFVQDSRLNGEILDDLSKTHPRPADLHAVQERSGKEDQHFSTRHSSVHAGIQEDDKAEGDTDHMKGGISSQVSVSGMALVHRVQEELQSLHKQMHTLETNVDRLYGEFEKEILKATRLLDVETMIRGGLDFLSTFKQLEKETEASVRASTLQKLLNSYLQPHASSSPVSSSSTSSPPPLGSSSPQGGTSLSYLVNSLPSFRPLVKCIEEAAVSLRLEAERQQTEALHSLSSLSLASSLDILYFLGDLWKQVESILRSLVSGVCTPPFPIDRLKAEAKSPEATTKTDLCTFFSSFSERKKRKDLSQGDNKGRRNLLMMPADLQSPPSRLKEGTSHAASFNTAMNPFSCRSPFEFSLTHHLQSFFDKLEAQLKKASLVDQVVQAGEDYTTRRRYADYLAETRGMTSSLSSELWRSSCSHLDASFRQLLSLSLPSIEVLAFLSSQDLSRRQRRSVRQRRAIQSFFSSEREKENVSSRQQRRGGEEEEEKKKMTGDVDRRKDELKVNEEEKKKNLERKKKKTDQTDGGIEKTLEKLQEHQIQLIDAAPILSSLFHTFLRRCDYVASAGALLSPLSTGQRQGLLSSLSLIRGVYIHLFYRNLEKCLCTLFSPDAVQAVKSFLLLLSFSPSVSSQETKAVDLPLHSQLHLPHRNPSSVLDSPEQGRSGLSQRREEEEERERNIRETDKAAENVLICVTSCRSPSQADVQSFLHEAFKELYRVDISGDDEALRKELVEAFEDVLGIFLSICDLQILSDREGGGEEKEEEKFLLRSLLTSEDGEKDNLRLVSRFPPVSPAYIRRLKIFGVLRGLEEGLYDVFNHHPRLFLLLLMRGQAKFPSFSSASGGVCGPRPSCDGGLLTEKEAIRSQLKRRKNLERSSCSPFFLSPSKRAEEYPYRPFDWGMHTMQTNKKKDRGKGTGGEDNEDESEEDEESNEQEEEEEEEEEEMFVDGLCGDRGIGEEEEEISQLFLEWPYLQDIARARHRLISPLFSSIAHAAIEGCLVYLGDQTKKKKLQTQQQWPPLHSNRPAYSHHGQEKREEEEDEEEEGVSSFALTELGRLLSYVHHQYFSLLPANTVTPYLSHLCSTILKNLVAHACVSEGSDESSRARVAALIARGEVLLSTFWSDLHKQLKVWTGSRLRNLRRLLFADTPLLLHEASQILKNHQKERKEQRDEEETLKDQPTHQQQEERSLSSSSSRMALNACVFLSLPPLLVISHLLYRLPRCPSSSTSRRIDARQSTESYNRRPHEILHISPSQLAKELSLCIDSSLDEKRNNIDIIRVEEGGEEDERERKELLSSLKLTQDLAYVVEVLKGKKSETSLYSGDGISRGDQEAEMKSISRIRHLRKKGSWRKEKKRQEKRELELLQNVLSLLEHNTKEEESHMERGDQALYPSPPIQEKEEERERSSSSSSSSSDIFQGSTLSFSSPSPPPPHTYPPPPHSYEQHRVLFDSSAPSPSSPSLLPHS